MSMTSSGDGRSRPRALVVAYCFPPNSAIGTLRPLRLVKQLAADGWETMVLAGAPSSYPEGTRLDAELLGQVPATTTLVRAGAVRGLSWLSRLVRRVVRRRRAGAAPGGGGRTSSSRPQPRLGLQSAIEHLFSIPDGDAGWFVPGVVRGLSATWRRRPDVLLSTAPSWTGHLVAGVLAACLRCRWVADFRDPWARGPWRRGRPAFVARAVSALERLTVQRADALMFATHALRDEIVGHYGAPVASKCHVVPNGCDLDEFAGLSAPPPDGRFVLAHVGTLYGQRDPVPLLRAIAAALHTGRIERGGFTLRLIGLVALPGRDLPAVCRELGLDDVVEFVPSLSRRESLMAMLSASALLLVQADHPLAVPAKTYEYLAAGRPILALVDAGETADVLRASGTGFVVNPRDEDAIAAALADLVRNGGEAARPAAPALFDGRLRAVEMVAVLEALCGAASPMSSRHARAGSLS